MRRGKSQHYYQAIVSTLLACAAVVRADNAVDQAGVGNIVDFLPSVLEMTGDPPAESYLNTICQVHIAPDDAPDQGYATVLGVGGDKALVIAFSPHKLERPYETITLRGVFVKPGEPHPTDEGTMDWAYIFDRNQDGKIDFFSYLVGPIWVAPDAGLDGVDLPLVKHGVPADLFESIRDKLRMGFWHLADDNYDGYHDGLMARTIDNTSGWADGWVMVSDSDFDTDYDTCTWVEGSNDATPEECWKTKSSYEVPGKSFGGLRSLPPLKQSPAESQFKAFNSVVDACQLDANRLYNKPLSPGSPFTQDGADAEAPSDPNDEQHPCYEGLDYESCHPLALEGDAEAQLTLGVMYATGKGVSVDDEEAVQWLRKAAEQGHRSAEYNLGEFYYYGKGWYRKAAEHGNPLAQYKLGLMYKDGDSVPQDDEEAVKWFRKAAEQGRNARPQYALGLAYANGRGVPKDYVQAYAWFAVAWVNGSAEARRMIDKVVSFMTHKQVAEAKELAHEIIEEQFETQNQQTN
jgi:tetratricopeptide (TPR) repeat protein